MRVLFYLYPDRVRAIAESSLRRTLIIPPIKSEEPIVNITMDRDFFLLFLFLHVGSNFGLRGGFYFVLLIVLLRTFL